MSGVDSVLGRSCRTGRAEKEQPMTQYLLKVYQPVGGTPPPEVLESVMRDVDAVDQEMRAAGV